MKKQIQEERGQEKRIIERLREGERIKCEFCKKGYLVTYVEDISKSHGFCCEECGAMINEDPIINIE